MDVGKRRLVLTKFMLTGFTLVVAGGLLAYYFNSIAASMLPVLRLAGLAIGLVMVLVGCHIAIVSIYSLKRANV